VSGTVVVARQAFDLVANWMQSTISSRDHWHIVTSVRNAHNEEAAKDLLDSFYDETLGGLNTTRTVLVRGEQKLHEVMSDYALKVKARLLVFGSSSLSAGSNMRRLGSVTLTALKALSLPILVVKDDTKRTDLKKYFASERNKVGRARRRLQSLLCIIYRLTMYRPLLEEDEALLNSSALSV
jgi:nucleotide-binding universal stress UspA family protein